MNSVALTDKPKGMTSFDVVEKIAGKFGVEKAGHTGTLDPNVTGLMVIALGEARKAMPVLTGMDKEYEGEMTLHDDVDRKTLEKAMKSFVGEITQLPPVRSRVARRERVRRVSFFRLLKKEKRTASFRVKCQAGTYIRKLIHDLGSNLGMGAHMSGLRRIKVGPFSVNESRTIEEISEKDLIPLERILERIRFKKIKVKDSDIRKIRNGVPVPCSRKINEEMFGIYDKKGNIIALGKRTGETIKAKRVFNQ